MDAETSNDQPDSVAASLENSPATVRLNRANTPPQPTPNTNQTATVGMAFSYTVNEFNDAETPNSLIYKADIRPTNGLSFDPVTRVISGLPSTIGMSYVTITATDPGGQSSSSSLTITAYCTNPEYAVLMDLYNATDGPNWIYSNWGNDCIPCNWFGVTCDNTGRVISINLARNRLRGSIPSSLGNLSNLRALELGYNQLNGTIPNSLSALSNLSYLGLVLNELSGSIPTSFSALTNLNSLELGYNQLSGSIPDGLSDKLQYLYLRNNQLNGNLPNSLNRLFNLTVLDLGRNSFNGLIPNNLDSLYNLQYFYLDGNKLSGSIPKSLSALTNLQYLDLSSNQLSGEIPSSLSTLKKLNGLILNSNQLSGCIPSSLSALCTKYVSLSNNPNLPSGGDFYNFCANGTGRGNGQVSTSAASATVGSVLSLSASGGASYQWSSPAGALLSNPATNAVVSATLINSGTQTFRVSIYNGIDCSQELPLSIDVINAPMPVNLVSFSAQAINNQTVQLDWTTASEQNNKYFLIERSKDLVQVESVAQVKAHEGNSFQGFTYTFADEKPYTGTSYYRLQQVDFDGKTTTYPWESVVLRREAYGVSPNPISNQQFRLQLDEPLTGIIMLYGLDGRQIPFQKIAHNISSLQLKTEQKLPAGVYILTVEERGQKHEYRIVVE